MSCPLVLDVDGTLTRPDASLDPRIFDPLRDWEEPVVIATGKVLAHANAVCRFIGIDDHVIAENGGIVYSDDRVEINGDGEAARRVAEDLAEEGHGLGWGSFDLVNRWRETEIAVSREVSLDAVEEIAERHGLEVYDTKYAYHVKSPDVDKGRGLVTVSDIMGRDPEEFVAVGDSENDVSTFEVVGESYAVSNADERALDAADHVTEESYADGLLEALDGIR
ncbi:phosphoglycolate phosphatase [Halorutilales archaeon Cl-col2-1]